jgi:hypothetical protein
MPLGIIERFGGKVLAWSSAIVLILALVGLLVATGESLRRQEHRSPFTQVVEPDLPLQSPEAPVDIYHSPGVAAWPTP